MCFCNFVVVAIFDIFLWLMIILFFFVIFLDCIIKAQGTLVSCGKDKKKRLVGVLTFIVSTELYLLEHEYSMLINSDTSLSALKQSLCKMVWSLTVIYWRYRYSWSVIIYSWASLSNTSQAKKVHQKWTILDMFTCLKSSKIWVIFPWNYRYCYCLIFV